MPYTRDKIFEILKTKKISQQEFAEGIGVTKQTVSNWKAGTSNSFLKQITEIANYLGEPVEVFFDKSETSNALIENITKNAPAEDGKSTFADLLKVFSTEEIKFLSTLSRDEADKFLNSIRKSRQK